jgi:hypothetical protein
MTEHKEPIGTIPELLVGLYCEWMLGSDKTEAAVFYYTDHPENYPCGGIYLEENFDDGKGHSGAFTTDHTPVAKEVFLEARALGFISGQVKPGRVSKHCFRISKLGENEYNRLELWNPKSLEIELQKLAQKAADAANTPITVNTIRDLLERMYQQPGSGKSHTELFHTPENADRPIWVREDYQDKIVGTPVAEHVFAEAVREQYISDDFGGWGIQKRCYLLTERGKIEYAHLHVDAEGA